MSEHQHDRVEVRLDTDGERFVVEVDGQAAGVAEFRHRNGHWIFTHTEIDPSHEGEGLGSVVARAALDHVRSVGEQVVPLCPFIAGWIDRHPDYEPLVNRPLTDELSRS